MVNSEKTPLAPPNDTVSYDTAKPPEAKRHSSVLSSLSAARKYSTDFVMGIMVPKNFWPLMVAAALCTVSSLAAIFSNSILFKERGFPVLFAQPIQQFGAVLVSVFIGEIANCCRRRDQKPFWPRFSMTWSSFISLFPLACAYVPRVYFTNLALGKLAVSCYPVFRNTAILFSVVFSWIMLRMRPTFLITLSCFVIFSGCLFSLKGIQLYDATIGIASGFFASLYLVIVKYYLPDVDNDTIVLMNHNASTSLVLLVPLVIVTGDYRNVAPFLPWTPNHVDSYVEDWLLLGITVFSSFAIALSSMMLVKEASPVAYDAINVLKVSIQGMLGWVWRGDDASWGKIVGFVFSIVGSVMYGKLKHQEHVNKVKGEVKVKKRGSDLKRMTEASIAQQ